MALLPWEWVRGDCPYNTLARPLGGIDAARRLFMAQGHDQVNEVLQATDIVEVIGELGRYAESRAACKAAIAIKPDHAGPMVWQVVQ